MNVPLRIATGYAVVLSRSFTGYPLDNHYSRCEPPMDIQWINYCCLGIKPTDCFPGIDVLVSTGEL